jgi:serine/threonine protein kinase
MSKPKPAPLPAGTVVGGYSVVKKLAAGGFGVVYLAEDADRHNVAIKEYLPASLAERSRTVLYLLLVLKTLAACLFQARASDGL